MASFSQFPFSRQINDFVTFKHWHQLIFYLGEVRSRPRSQSEKILTDDTGYEALYFVDILVPSLQNDADISHTIPVFVFTI